MKPHPLPLLAVAALGASALLGLTPAHALPTPAASQAHDVTDPVEAARMNAVQVPQLQWSACGDGQCAKIAVPLSYDAPTGPTTTITMVKFPARKPAERLGVLALNPGGPGDSAVTYVKQTAKHLYPVLRDRFDVLGIEPRGIGESERVHCFPSAQESSKISGEFQALANPRDDQIARKQELASAYAASCMTNGKALATSMNTTNHVRDIELIRRALGEPTMNIFGVSYGSAIAQFYGNMFPEYARALASDGVIDPTQYVGSAASPKTVDDRILSSAGAKLALDEVLRRCSAADSACKFYQAGMTGPAKMAELERRIQAKPIPNVPMAGSKNTVDYLALYTHLTALLYSPSGASFMVDDFLQRLWTLSTPTASTSQKAAAYTALAELDQRVVREQRDDPLRRAPGYDNLMDAHLAVMCGDGFNPQSVSEYARSAAASRATRAGFGPFRVWSMSPCHNDAWTAIDPSRYVGPFTKRPRTPMLFIGNDFDPATPKAMAISSAAQSPGAGLVTSDGWGHLATDTSACVKKALLDYLVNLTVPVTPLRCKTDMPGLGTPLP